MLVYLYEKIYSCFLGTGVSKYKIIQKIHDILETKIKSKIVEIDGIKFQVGIDNVAQIHAANRKEIEYCKKEIKPGSIVLDVGANVGYYTLFLSKIVGDDGKVYAFEPEPKNYDIIKKNLEINHITNVEIINKAVSDKKSIQKLFLSPGTTGGHSMIKNEWGGTFVEVETITLDEFCKDKKIDFMKIDVEGHEFEVIKGGMEVLRENRKMKIISEFGNYYYKTNNGGKIYLDLLEELGFELVASIDKNKGNADIIPMKYEELQKFYQNNDRFILNLFWN